LVERNNGIVEVNGSIPLRSNSLLFSMEHAMSFFESVPMLPEDPIFGLNRLYQADPRPNKVNLGVGAYQDAQAKPYVLETIQEAEKRLFQKGMSKEYLPIDGNSEYIQETIKLVFGSNCSRVTSGEIYAAQTVGGTSALRLGGDFLRQNETKGIFLSDPTWPNHQQIFSKSHLQIEFYKYYDKDQHRVNFDAMCDAIKAMPRGAAILLQACCHNPTGMDLSFAQWQELSDLIKKQQIFPFFDFAYQGFGDDLEKDAKAIRYFADQGHEMMVAASYSKNFGLYGERVGMFAMVARHSDIAKRCASQIKQLIRSNYSNPPRFGAALVALILKSDELSAGWKRELQSMRGRIQEMREALAFGLMSEGIHVDFSFLMKQKGMFSFSGLEKHVVERLRVEKGIYLVGNGRMNVAGLNPSNLEYVVESILAVVKNEKKDA
jgi:aspartate aminotransferase